MTVESEKCGSCGSPQCHAIAIEALEIVEQITLAVESRSVRTLHDAHKRFDTLTAGFGRYASDSGETPPWCVDAAAVITEAVEISAARVAELRMRAGDGEGALLLSEGPFGNFTIH